MGNIRKKYIEKFKSSPNSAGNESSTNTALFGTASIDSIPQNSENATKKYSINVKELTSEDDNMLKEYFGTTKNFDVAGYMLKDGSMLDFSGRNWGETSSKMRQVDHRDINEVLDEENYGDAMINMIANGNIRLMSERGGINLAVAPTKEQKEMLREYIKSFRGEVIVSFDKKGGNAVESIAYDKGTDIEKIFSGIDNIKEIDSGDVASKGTQRNDQSLDKSRSRNRKNVNKKYKSSCDIS